MQNKTLLMAFMFSASIHGALILPIFPVIRNFPIEDGSNRMSISMGGIIISREKTKKPCGPQKNSEVIGESFLKISEARNREFYSQVPTPYSSNDTALGRSGEEENDKGKARNQYFAEIRKRIEEAKRYPRLARNKGFEGASQIEFIVLSDGKIQEIKLVDSSDYQILDDEAVATIRRASPFPPIPQEFGELRIKIAIPIVFELKGGDGI